jgi:hypothetical protein
VALWLLVALSIATLATAGAILVVLVRRLPRPGPAPLPDFRPMPRREPSRPSWFLSPEDDTQPDPLKVPAAVTMATSRGDLQRARDDLTRAMGPPPLAPPSDLPPVPHHQDILKK